MKPAYNPYLPEPTTTLLASHAKACRRLLIDAFQKTIRVSKQPYLFKGSSKTMSEWSYKVH